MTGRAEPLPAAARLSSDVQLCAGQADPLTVEQAAPKSGASTCRLEPPHGAHTGGMGAWTEAPRPPARLPGKAQADEQADGLQRMPTDVTLQVTLLARMHEQRLGCRKPWSPASAWAQLSPPVHVLSPPVHPPKSPNPNTLIRTPDQPGRPAGTKNVVASTKNALITLWKNAFVG
eukprot:364942-Chlamydomonas_euryale.AAC.12